MRIPARCLLLALPLLALPVAAQKHRFLLEETVVSPGMGGQFESAQKDYCAAIVRGGAPSCLVFSIATFGQSGIYFTLLPFSSFLHYDQGKYTDKGMTREQANALSARRTPAIAANHESALVLDRDLSFSNASNTDKPLNLFVEYRVRPGCLNAFLARVHSMVLPEVRKSGTAAFEVLRTVLGESTDRVFLVTRLDNFAQLDEEKSLLNESAFGSDFLAQNVEHIDTYILRYRADLSSAPTNSAQ